MPLRVARRTFVDFHSQPQHNLAEELPGEPYQDPFPRPLLILAMIAGYASLRRRSRIPDRLRAYMSDATLCLIGYPADRKDS